MTGKPTAWNAGLQPRRILVTGAAGFIGHHLVAALATVSGLELYALVRRPVLHQMSGVHYVYQDLTQPFDRRYLPAGLDAVVHLAAAISFDERDPAQRRAAFDTNVSGTLRLLEYAQEVGAGLFLYGSTGGIYGCRDEPIDESAPFNPLDFYSVTKCQAELEVGFFAPHYSTVILRYFFPYGSGTPNPIQNVVESVLHGRSVRVVRSGTPAINPLHIDDAVAATVCALSLSGHYVLNIAGDERTSFRDIAERVARIIGGDAARPSLHLVDETEAHPFHRSNALARTERARRVLGWQPTISLDEGLRRFVTELRGE
jgi:nucleoside-diphosphate-sugar epimerase